VRSQCGLHAIMPSPELPHKAVTLISRREGYKSPASLAFAELASEWATRRLEETPPRKLKPCPLAKGKTFSHPLKDRPIVKAATNKIA